MPSTPEKLSVRLIGISTCLAALSVAGVVWALAAMSLDHSVSQQGREHNLPQLLWFWIASGVCWLTLTGVWIAIRRTPSSPVRVMPWAGVVLAIAAVARVAVLLSHQPTLSDDIHRYVFDGENLSHAINPYLPVPLDRASVPTPAWEGESLVASRINNPELTTIYLPTSQYAFAAFAWSSTNQGSLPVRIWLVVVEMVMIALLLLALHLTRMHPLFAALYAWHPLALTEIAASGHQDVLGAALLVGALVVFSRRPKAIEGWTLPLALATLVKPVAAPIALACLKGRSLSSYLRSLACGAIVCMTLAAPLLLTSGGAPLEALWETTQRFSLKWAHFGSVYEPLLWAIEQATSEWTNDQQEQVARAICLVIVLCLGAWLLYSKATIWARARAFLFMLVLLSAAAHPWYLLWALALAPLAMSPALWIASLTLLWSYAAWTYHIDDDGRLVWGAPTWVMVASWVPVYASLAVQLVFRGSRS